MTSRKKSRWDSLTKKAITAGETLAMRSSGGRFPIPLSKVAAERNIREVIFRPSVVDGCLGMRHDGLVIFVKSDQIDSKELYKRFESEDSNYSPLSNRMRFTIAHEIAHTFFLDTKLGSSKRKIAAPLAQSVNSLEYACNTVASSILLPSQLLRKTLETLDVFNPLAWRKLAQETAVSAKTLTIRVAQVFDWSGQFGALLCVQHVSKTARVLSYSAHPLIRPFLRKFDRNALPIKEIINEPSFILNGGDKYCVSAKLPCLIAGKNAVQPIIVNCEDCDTSSIPTYFVTIKQTGNIQLL